MLGWRRIASYDDVQSARARIWGKAREQRPSEVDHAMPPRVPARVGLTMAVGMCYGTATVATNMSRPTGTEETPYTTPVRPMPVGKTEIPLDIPVRAITASLDRGKGAEEGKVDAMAKYLSKEWVEAGRAHVEKDHRFADITRGVQASVLCIVHDVPDHADEVFYIAFADGRLIDLYSGDRKVFDTFGKSPSFEVHGTYNTYMKIQEGHLTQTTAVMRGMLRLKGSWLKALRYIRALEELTTILREVPTEY